MMAGPLPEALGRLDKLCVKSGYLAGGNITIADIVTYCRVRYFRNGGIDGNQGIPKDICEGHPNLVALCKKIEEIPAVKAHYKL